MSSKLRQYSLKTVILGITLVAMISMGWLPMISATEALAQSGKRVRRAAPSMGVLMLAFDAATAGDKNLERTNPELVRAMREVLASDSDVRKAFQKLHDAYKATSAQRRAEMAGQEIASASSSTLSTDLVKRALFTKRTEPGFGTARWDDFVDAAPATRGQKNLVNQASYEAKHPDQPPGVKPDRTVGDKRNVPPKQMPAVKTSRLMLEPDGRQSSATSPDSDDRTFAAGSAEMLTPLLTPVSATAGTIPISAFKIIYRGMRCGDEGDDWGSSSEPYIIFVLQQGDAEPVTIGPKDSRFGPYDGTDTWDNVYRTVPITTKNTFMNPLQITAFAWENDDWDPADVQSAIQGAVKVVCKLSGYLGYDCPEWIPGIIDDVFSWVGDVAENDDDQVGTIQLTLARKDAVALSKTSKFYEGFNYDAYLTFKGSSYVFSYFLDIVPDGTVNVPFVLKFPKKPSA